jgi:hypothetical protein
MVGLPSDCVSGCPEGLDEAVGPLHLHGQVGGPVGGRQGLHQFLQVIIHLGPTNEALEFISYTGFPLLTAHLTLKCRTWIKIKNQKRQLTSYV